MAARSNGDWPGILAGNRWFASLPPVVQSGLLAGTVRRLDRGETLFRQGGPVEGLAAVLEGQLAISGAAADGSSTLVAFHRPGDWTGILATLDGQPHPFTASAVQPSIVLLVRRQRALELFEQDVATFRKLVEPELELARRTYDFVNCSNHMPAASRLSRRLIELAGGRQSASDGKLYPLEGLKQDELAGAVRLSRQTVNGILRQLVHHGAIAVSRERIDILDPQYLQEIASGANWLTGNHPD